jgi:hypothetical protein
VMSAPAQRRTADVSHSDAPNTNIAHAAYREVRLSRRARPSRLAVAGSL